MNIVWKARKRLKFFGLPWTFTKYSLTEDKFLVDTGFFNKVQEETRLYRILDMTLSRTFGQRLFGLGTITCKTADQSTPILKIENIRKSQEVKEVLSELVEKERVSKRVFSRESMSDPSVDHFDLDGDGECDIASHDHNAM